MRKAKSVIQSFRQDESTPLTSKRMEIPRILGLLNTTNDIDLLVKLISALSAYLLIYKDNYDTILRCDAVYDKLQLVLSRGVQKQAVVALNFLTMMLYVDEADDVTSHGKMLGGHVRARCRTSGCLAIINDMFANRMMYHDTWKALCQCLTSACSECEMNQSYCTYLIPVCVRKWSETHMDVFLVLHSLLFNHTRNTQLFLKCNGTSLFTREFLHNDQCLQLLITVVRTDEGISMIRQTQVAEDLRNFLYMYGPSSEIGQKAMIILNHIDSRNKGLDYHIAQNISKEKVQETNANYININKTDEELDDTDTLMQNVMKEVYAYKQSENKHLDKTKYTMFMRDASSARKVTVNNRQINRIPSDKTNKHILHRTRGLGDADLTFSFLANSKTVCNEKYERSRFRNINNSTRRFYNANMNIEKTKTLSNIPRDIPASFRKTSNDTSAAFELDQSFMPIFSSTPKYEENTENKVNLAKIKNPKPNATAQLHVRQHGRVQKRKPYVPINKDVDLRNKTLRSRFFKAINDSCTTLVKTVANIFKKKDTQKVCKDTLRSCSSLEDENQSCSYSFMKYMQKRDAVLNSRSHTSNTHITHQSKDTSMFSLETQLCETCDNTAALKRKLVKNEHLRKTIKKLKIGINLFGCDFKRISRTMWPRESYMTPAVLYNLYRKLIVK